MSETFEALKGTKTVLLRSYKRDGTPVPTPVSIAFDGDRAFFRSYDKAWKTKRLRNNPSVEVAPSTLGGRVTGTTLAARARVADSGARPTPYPLAIALRKSSRFPVTAGSSGAIEVPVGGDKAWARA